MSDVIDIEDLARVDQFYSELKQVSHQKCLDLKIDVAELDLEVQQLLTDTCKSGEDIIAALTPLKAHLWHMMTGVSGESGELTDVLKKIIIYNKPSSPGMLENVVEELADLLYYTEGIKQVLNISDNQIKMYLLQKLRKRYGQRYSDTQAINRADKTQNQS